MSNRAALRIACLLLCLCLLPAAALAELKQSPSPVTHADFTLRLNLHADGFPQPNNRLRDWETFLQKISLRARADVQDFLTNESRVYMKGAVAVNNREVIPFTYDGYHSYRYLVSPALANEVFHFQMHNYFDFMMKPYFYMELPTQYIALLTYPEASYYLGKSYYEPIAAACEGEGTRTVPYTRLYELCEELDLIANEDEYYGRLYTYMRALLIDIYADDMTVDALGRLEDFLAFLDPDEGGMTITVDGNTTTYIIGETTVFQRTVQDGRNTFTLTLPNEEGYCLSVDYDWQPTENGVQLDAKLLITQGEQTAFSLTIAGTGLPQDGDKRGEGTLSFAIDGYVTGDQPPAPASLAFRWESDSPQLPRTLLLDVDYLHPETGRPALTLSFNGKLADVDPSVLVEYDYPQNDFFNLNGESLTAIEERITKPLAVSMLPVIAEMPSGVIDSIYDFITQTGILNALTAE